MTTVTQERQKLAGIRPLITREQWGSTFDYSDARAVTEPAEHVFVHITITNPDSYSSDYAHARAVEAIGKSRFPSTGISYNRLHFQSGRAMEGQPIGRRGAHTVNDLSRTSCVTSGCPSRGADLGDQINLNYNARAYVICQNVGHTVTDAELHALAKSIAADKVAGFVLRDAPIHGHRCVSSKSCPGDLMWARMGELERLVDHYIAVFTQEAGNLSAEDADRVINTLKTYLENEVAAAGRYAHIVDTLTKWAEEKDNTRQAALITLLTDHQTALVAKFDEVIAAVNAREGELAAAGRYSHIVDTLTKWAETQDNIRHTELLAKLAELHPQEPPPLA